MHRFAYVIIHQMFVCMANWMLDVAIGRMYIIANLAAEPFTFKTDARRVISFFLATDQAAVFYQLGVRTCCSYSHSLPSLVMSNLIPYLPLPILVHSNPVSSYLLFRPFSP